MDENTKLKQNLDIEGEPISPLQDSKAIFIVN